MSYSLNNCRGGITAFLLVCLGLLTACQNVSKNAETGGPTSLAQVPAARLSFRYEADVPGPPEASKPTPTEERNAAVQANFDQSRTQDVLDKTITSPDKKHVLAVYHQVNDIASEFRLDMYAPDGKLLRKVTPDTMAVHFPDTIIWAPDSSAVAFVAMVRAGQAEGSAPPPTPDVTPPPGPEDFDKPTEPGAETNSNANSPPPTQTPVSPVGVLTFRTEQIYLGNADGDGVKPLTQSEGKIYFYFVWSPDSRMLAAMAATSPEWRAAFGQAEGKGEVFVPPGRLRIVEKTGRERLLDDGLTQVHPVWSPDSSKVAGVFFDTQIRIYDVAGNTPTQAGMQLRNQLLLSSQAYDQELERKAQAENTVADNSGSAQPTAPANTAQPATTLPDPAKLVSFSPIIDLEWTSDDILYFQTGYVKEYKNAADSRRSYLRWHRLVFSPQSQAPTR